MAAISLALVIWFVYPAITNGTDGLLEKYGQLKKEKEKSAQLETKSQNVKKLSAQLASSPEEKKVLFQFLPDSMKEEEIIDNLNFLATNSSLSVIDLSVGQPAEEAVEETAAVAGPPVAADTSGQGLMGGEEGFLPVTEPAERNFEVTFSVVGDYEKVKDLLGKISALERFNGIKTLEIRKPTGQEGTGNSLITDTVLKFNFLKKRDVLPDVESSAFGLEKFSMKTIGDIKNSKSTAILKLNIDQAGKANPFLP